MATAAKPPPPVLLVTHPACVEHEILNHPEQPARLGSIVEAVEKAFGPQLIVDRNPPAATEKQLAYFHTPKHIRKVQQACARAESIHGKMLKKHGASALISSPKGDALRRKLEVEIDGDTAVMAGSREAALRAAGGAIAAVDAVLTGRASSAFCAVRPPGHHAEPGEAMGFCLFGNVGIAAHHARRAHGLQRVACVDWDVHHGNGTQKGFEKDPDLFFGSSHQMPCYPGTGSPKEKGVAANVVNVGLKPGSGSKEFRAAWSKNILPALRAFRPELIFVSAGFDAHGDDPLAECNLADEDFGWVQGEIMTLAREVCRGRVVSVLEGGYDLSAIARSAVECVRAQITGSEADDGGDGDGEDGGGEVAAAGSEADDPIVRFRGDHFFLSNMHPSPCAYEGDAYPSAEHAYQAAKFPRAERWVFFSSTSAKLEPRAAKELARDKAAELPDEAREAFQQRRLGVMEAVVRSKFAASSELRGLLLATGARPLVEGNHWHDDFWGVHMQDEASPPPPNEDGDEDDDDDDDDDDKERPESSSEVVDGGGGGGGGGGEAACGQNHLGKILMRLREEMRRALLHPVQPSGEEKPREEETEAAASGSGSGDADANAGDLSAALSKVELNGGD